MAVTKGKLDDKGDSKGVSQEVLDNLKKEILQDLINAEKAKKPSSAVIEDGSQARSLDSSDIEKLATAIINKRAPQDDSIRLLNEGEADIDPDDHMDEAVLFFAPSVGYVIVDDVRRGMRSMPPLRQPIIFKYEATKRTHNGKHEEVFNYSVFRCESKATKKWMEEHSGYGIAFYNNAQSVFGEEAKKNARMTTIMQQVRRYSSDQLLRIAKDNGLNIVPDPDEMKSIVGEFFVKREMRKENELQATRMSENAKAMAEMKGMGSPA